MGIVLWLGQRISALFMMTYVSTLYIYFSSYDLNYENWSCFFGSFIGKTALIFFSSMFALHASIGLWTISTDYIRHVVIRRTLLCLYFFCLILSICALALA